MKKIIYLMVFGLFFIALQGFAVAKQGLYVGLDLAYDGIISDDIKDQLEIANVANLNLNVGIGLTDSITIGTTVQLVGFNVDSNVLDDELSFGGWTLDLKYSILKTAIIEPFVLVGVALAYGLNDDNFWNALSDSENSYVSTIGNNFHAGVGADVYLVESISVGAAILYRYINFNQENFDVTEFVSDKNTRADTISTIISVAYHF